MTQMSRHTSVFFGGRSTTRGWGDGDASRCTGIWTRGEDMAHSAGPRRGQRVRIPRARNDRCLFEAVRYGKTKKRCACRQALTLQLNNKKRSNLKIWLSLNGYTELAPWLYWAAKRKYFHRRPGFPLHWTSLGYMQISKPGRGNIKVI